MSWPFLYFHGGTLTVPELSAARLDGILVEIGEAFMPADAVETRELRAAPLTTLIPPVVAATHDTAAWVHGVLEEPPSRHTVQRATSARIHHLFDRRLRYHDQRVIDDALETISGLRVTTPTRTLADLTRRWCAGEEADGAIVRAWCRSMPELHARALEELTWGPPLHHKRAAARRLAEL